NEQVDELLREAQRTNDQAERQRLYEEALRILVDDAPWAWIDHETQIVAMKKSIQGFKLHPPGVFRFENVDVVNSWRLPTAAGRRGSRDTTPWPPPRCR